MSDGKQPDLRFAAGNPFGKAYVKVSCPKHPDITPSLAVYHDHGWCFSCGTYFTPSEVLEFTGKRAEDLPETTEEAIAALAEKRSVVPNPLMVDIWHQTLVSPISPRRHRLQYLRDRGLKLATISQQRLGHTGKYFVLPVWGAGKGLRGLCMRRDDEYTDPDAPRYLKPAGQPALLYRPSPDGRVLAITEGEFDALLLSQFGVDALTTTAGAANLAPFLLQFWHKGGPKRRVYVCTDQDEAGEAAWMQLKTTLPTINLRRVYFQGGKDVTDALKGRSDAEVTAELRHWFN